MTARAVVVALSLVSASLVAQTGTAVMNGKVMDQDGDPVERASVELFRDYWQGGKLFRFRAPNGDARTNDLGEYHIGNLAPGKYYLLVTYRSNADNGLVSANGKPDVRPLPTFYPQAATLSTSTPLTVQAGQVMTGINIVIRRGPTYHIRGKVLGEVRPHEGYRVQANTTDPEGRIFLLAGGATVASDGTFDITGVPPGKYTLQARATVHFLGTEDVTVSNADVNDVVIPRGSFASIRGKVVFEGTPARSETSAASRVMRVILGVNDLSSTMACGNVADVAEDNTFILDNLTPAHCHGVRFTGRPLRSYLKAVTFDDRPATGKTLDLTPGAHTLTLTFSYNGTPISGKIKDSATGPVLKAQVVLASTTLNEDGSGVYFSPYKDGSSFVFRSMPPGEYRAYAFEQVNENQFQNPAFRQEIESKGAVVKVSGSDPITLQLPLIPADEVQRIMTRLDP